jgi:hypothetical protein
LLPAPEEEGEVDDGDDDNEPLQTTNVHKCDNFWGAAACNCNHGWQ